MDENEILQIKKFLRKIEFKGDKNNYRGVTVLKRGVGHGTELGMNKIHKRESEKNIDMRGWEDEGIND